MNNKRFFDIALPKWPAMVVVGESVSILQAKEILIRTDSLWFSTNDREFKNSLNEYLFGFKSQGYEDIYDTIRRELNVDPFKYMDLHLKQYNILDINYLRNYRICSSWIGGAHGWCNWDGTIFSSNYNIGKWPKIEEVYDEWCTISEAFPYLDLTCQLLDGETCEDAKPVIEFRVKKGKVTMHIPTKLIAKTEELDFTGILKYGGERGCTLVQFIDAIEYVKSIR